MRSFRPSPRPAYAWPSRLVRFGHAVLMVLSVLTLSACAQVPANSHSPEAVQTLVASLPASGIVLLGEQHDATQHQQVQAEVTRQLAQQQRLAAVVLEMAEAGRSTAGLPPSASEADVQTALAWEGGGWPWAAYGPGIMQAVRMGVEVAGGNLPRARMRATMADRAVDARLPADAWSVQEQRMQDGHCNLLPASQLRPMARIQTARDISLADTTLSRLQPGRIVLVWAGSEHADRRLGIPRYLALPSGYSLLSVRLVAGTAPAEDDRFDRIWRTPAVLPRDHCAELRQTLRPQPASAPARPASAAP